jgi:hypothetical protein
VMGMEQPRGGEAGNSGSHDGDFEASA